VPARLHLGNVVAAEREPWLVIYPKPLVGEPAFDVGQLPADALAGDSGIDRVEFARWAYDIDEVDEGGPEGRLTFTRSLAGLAER